MLCYLLLFSLFYFGFSDNKILNLNVPPFLSTSSKDVILTCQSSNEDIKKVQWFFNDQLFYEWFPQNFSSLAMGRLKHNVDLTYKSPSYSLNTSEIRLINISTKLSGDYKCKLIGVGNEDQTTKTMFIYTEPILTGIKFFPSNVIKGKSLTLECILDDPGIPRNVSYIWFRRGYRIHESIHPKWVINQASLDARTTFSCIATNGVSQSRSQKVSIDVLAPPTILGKTSSYISVSYLTKEFSLSCKFECYPLCSIAWYKDGHLLNTEIDPLYQEVVQYKPPNYTKNDFESVMSILIWKISNWPNQRLDRNSPLSKYTCSSVSVADGPGPDVNFTTIVSVDVPPENLKLSAYRVNVVEGSRPVAPIQCNGEGRPKLEYLWKSPHSEIMQRGSKLYLNEMFREHTGYYICEGYNRHGSQSVKFFVNVQYLPKCILTKGIIQRQPAVICSADANPKEVSFGWDILNFNTSSKNDDVVIKKRSGRWYSYITLNPNSNETMVYQCVAKNSIGFSYPCQIEVSRADRKKGLLSFFWRMVVLPAYYFGL